MKIISLHLALLVVACDHAPIRPIFYGSSRGEDKSTGTGDQTTNIAEIKLDTSVYHRLNRYEYNNAIEDLLGLTTKPADDFPTDPSTHGFDNVAANLSLTPGLTDQLNQASEKISIAALKDHPRSTVAIDLVAGAGGMNGNAMGTSWSIIGTIPYAFTLKYDESLTFVLVMAGKSSNAANPKSTVKVDGKVVAVYDSKGAGEPETNVFAIDLTKGDHTISLSFDNRVDPNAPASIFNTLVVDSIIATSKEMEITPTSRALTACLTATKPETCKSDLYLAFAKKAWRRPLTADEKTSLGTMWKSVIAAGGSDKDAFQAIIQAVTLSSKFLFRAVNPLEAGSKSVAAIDDYSLANRLSFLLWSSIPDEELLAAADRQELRDPAKLGAQFRRMLADPKSTRFVNGFASQWLYTRLLNQAHPDVTVFKDFDSDLRGAFTLESQMVFGDFLTNGKPISDLLSPGFTFANDRLAKHYGLNLPGSAIPKKVPVADNVRGGVLTHGAWLTVASLPSDTMPVKRGAWLMENILCQTVPPPPAVTPLDLGAVGTAKVTVRERFVKHLTNPSCASCHNLIDPIGFGLESYDAVGAFRTLDSVGNPVDTKGKIAGANFEDFSGMVKVIQDSRLFEQCLTKKLYAYALGRTIGANDTALLDSISKATGSNGTTLDGLLESIVMSPAFRMANFSEDL